MSDWDSPELVEWLKRATDKQQYYCDRLDDRDYDSFTGDDQRYLLIKIAFSLFGSPSEVDENQNEVEITAYANTQQETAKQIFEQIKAYSDKELQVAFIFLMIKEGDQEYQLPLIRFVASKEYKNAEYFVDHHGRVYESWENFTKWDEMPECLYCFPVDGWYKTDGEGRVQVDKATSSCCNVGVKVVKAADITSTVVNIGSLALLGGGFLCSAIFPPAAPALIAAGTYTGAGSGAYLAVRNTAKLVDRGVHGQSLNPISDSAARSCWLGTVGGALGVGTLGTARYITYLAKEGEVASRVLRATFNTLEVSSLTVNGLGIVSNIVELTQKEEVTVLDVANLSLNILFFTNSVVNLRTARTMIKDTQKQVLDTSKMNMDPKAQEGFRAFAKQNKKESHSTMYGNARTIKGLKRIDNPNQFFSDLQQVRVDVRAANSVSGAPKNLKVRVNNDLLVSINGELKVHPSKWQAVRANAESRTQILECIGKITNSPSPQEASNHIKDIKSICSRERLTFERTRQETMKNLADRFGVTDAASVEINGKRVFENLRPHEIDRIGNVLEAKGKHATSDFLQCVTDVARDIGCESSGDYCGVMEYCFEYITEVRRNSEGNRPSILDVIHELNANDIAKQRLVERFQSDIATVTTLQKEAVPGFGSDVLATYHYCKHKYFGPQGKVSPERYFEMIHDITGRSDLHQSGNLTQEGNKMIHTFIDPVDGLKCITVEPIVSVSDESVLVATLFYDKRVHRG